MSPHRTAFQSLDRRGVLQLGSGCLAAVITGCAAGRSGPDDANVPGEAEVTPAEDLMQEHGLLERLLLVYETVAGRLDSSAAMDPAPLLQSARLVRRFVEDYHERLEERHVFPRLQARRVELPLVATLLAQHERGRMATEEILRLAPIAARQAQPLARVLREFVRMYRPHAAREDTVLFPAFRATFDQAAYRELGEQFEEQEHELLGPNGFESAVLEVGGIERALGLNDLASFTPA